MCWWRLRPSPSCKPHRKTELMITKEGFRIKYGVLLCVRIDLQETATGIIEIQQERCHPHGSAPASLYDLCSEGDAAGLYQSENLLCDLHQTFHGAKFLCFFVQLTVCVFQTRCLIPQLLGPVLEIIHRDAQGGQSSHTQYDSDDHHDLGDVAAAPVSQLNPTEKFFDFCHVFFLRMYAWFADGYSTLL